MTQPGETDGYTVADHLRALIDHIGPGVADYVLVNDYAPAGEVLERYAAMGSYPVVCDTEAVQALGAKVVRAKLIADGMTVSHAPDLVADAIVNMVHAVQSDLHPQLLDYYFDRSL